MAPMINLEQRLETWTIDSQGGSLLFRKLPPELRREIFALALAPDLKFRRPSVGGRELDLDFRLRHDHQGHPDDDIIKELATIDERPEDLRYAKLCAGIFQRHFPPGTGGGWERPLLSPQLLATCRRAFAESRLLVFETERYYKYCYCIGIGTWMPPRRLFPGDYRFCSSTHNGFSFRRPSPPFYWSRDRIEWECRFKRVRFGDQLHYYPDFLRKSDLPRWADVPRKRFQLSKTEHLRLSPPNNKIWYEPSTSLNCSIFYGTSWCPLLKWDPDVQEQWQARPMANLVRAGKLYREQQQLQLHQHQQTQCGVQPGPDEDPVPGRPTWITPHPEGQHCSYPVGSWAREFVNMPRIRTLTLDFHCPENVRLDFAAAVEMIVETWRFPLNPRHHDGYHYLSARGNPVRKLSWRGKVDHWPRSCFECGRRTFEPPAEWCETHPPRERASKDFGPRMYTWTVTWTRRRHDGPEVYPYDGCVGVDDGDYQEEGDSDLDPDEEGGSDPDEEVGLEVGDAKSDTETDKDERKSESE